ncbi:MAG: hypothetical protein AAGF11_48710 [Myxococcota bacterium]
MSMSPTDHAPSSGHGPPPADVERIAAELAALGEEPADDDELAVLTTHEQAHPDVRTVATLVELSTWSAPAQGLLPLEQHRVWRRIAQRSPAPSPVSEPDEPAANGFKGWRGLVAGLALVAGVIVLPRFEVPVAPSAEDRQATLGMGQAARGVLETLPGEQDGTRARALAEGYAERLAAVRTGSRRDGRGAGR